MLSLLYYILQKQQTIVQRTLYEIVGTSIEAMIKQLRVRHAITLLLIRVSETVTEVSLSHIALILPIRISSLKASSKVAFQ